MDPLENLQKNNEILNYENIKKLDEFLSIFKVEKGNQSLVYMPKFQSQTFFQK